MGLDVEADIESMFEAPPAQPVEKEVAKTRRQQRANFLPGLASDIP